jgi:RNA polymerase sigma factor (sigma-70 family)
VDTPIDHAAIEAVYRGEAGRVLATLIRLVGDFELAEEGAQEAFAAALERWPGTGVPGNPRAWLVNTGRHKAIDRLRRRIALRGKLKQVAAEAEIESRIGAPVDETGPDDIADDRLRLIFTCCHPALAIEAQVALTLRVVCGLPTPAIAKAFLTGEETMAQRLVRAKAKIRDARTPYDVPPRELLGERLAGVLAVVYLVFTEGYAPSGGEAATRPELCAEAIRLGRLIDHLLPGNAEVAGLLALMLLHAARLDGRRNGDGELLLLEEQDRSRWDRGRSPRARRWSSARWPGRPPSALTACRRRSRRSTPRRRAPPTRIGSRSPASTRCCSGCSRRRWSSSTRSRRCRWSMVRPAACNCSMRSRRAAGSTATCRSTPLAPTFWRSSAAATRPERPTAGRWRWRGSRPSGSCSSGGWRRCGDAGREARDPSPVRGGWRGRVYCAPPVLAALSLSNHQTVGKPIE